MKYKLNLDNNHLSLFVALIIFIIYIIRVLIFYYKNDQYLIGIIPDDAFYYIQLAKHRINDGFWTFDGTTKATGFHLLYGYILTTIIYIFPFLNWRELYLVIGILSSISISMAALICSITVGKLYTEKVIPLIVIPFLSLPILLQSTSMMESWLVIILAATAFYLLTKNDESSNKVLIIKLFIIGLLGSIARTDFGLLPGVLFIVAFIISNFRTNQIVMRAFSLLMGTACGLAASLIHNKIVSESFTQASANVKYLWSSIDGHSSLPVISMVSNMLVPVSVGKYSYIIIPMTILLLIIYTGYKAIKTKKFIHNETKIIIYFSATFTIIGYIFFYRLNSVALQNWYSANFLIPISIITASIYYYLPKYKILKTLNIIAIIFILIAIYRIKHVPYPHQYGMMQAGQFLKEQSVNETYASWNAGIISFFSEKPLINIDGLTNDEILPYIKTNKLFDYIRLKKITYLIDYEEMIRNEKLRKRGGYYDIRMDKCIISIAEVENHNPKWGDGSLKLYKVKEDCEINNL